jgi:hypothetical protein
MKTTGSCFLGAALLMVAVGGAAACERFALTAPARFDTVDTLQPVLRWNGGPAQTYRVQLAALLPEARVVMALDTEVTGNSFRLPAPLRVERAGVKVLVSRGCPQQDAQDLQAQGAWFFVDTRERCKVDSASMLQTPQGVAWQVVPAASAYTVHLFDAPVTVDGPLVSLGEKEVTANVWVMPGGERAPHVVTVRALCAGVPGRPAALVLGKG